ncbi:MAG: SAVED domain-containing protein [Candidatus Bathyarchaeia archaeon]
MIRLRRFLAEREAFIGIVIFGVLVMAADFCSDLNWHFVAASLRGVGIFALILLFLLDAWLRFRRQPLAVPLLFTTETNREVARRMFENFTETQRLSVKPLEQTTALRRDDLIIRLNHNPRNQTDPANPEHWRRAWQELLREWGDEVDRRLKRELPVGETICYHIHPHLWLPLAFAMGASVGLRRSIVLYHSQQDKFFRVLDLTYPRCLFDEPEQSVPEPEKVPEDFTSLPEAGKLILHLCISDRHDVPEFKAHSEHGNAANAGLVYRKALDPSENWLGYVQWLYHEARPLLGRYEQVDICLVCPSAIAFALGMAFSRTPKVTVCDYQNGRYVPVFSLAEIEKRLPFG